MALAYTIIAIANTLVMATSDRRHELATLRLSGATPGQVLRMIGVEACLVTGIGTLLAAAVTAVTVTACGTACAASRRRYGWSSRGRRWPGSRSPAWRSRCSRA